MNAAGLLKHFDRIAEAPDAVERLRRFVLDLAVRGKLVEQDATDESATQLLERINVVKKRLKNDGSIPAKAAASPVSESDMPFLLPANWQWARFGDICDFSAGRTPPRHDHSYWNSGDHPWASIADLDDGQILLTTKETVSEKARLSVFGASPQPVGTMLMSFKLTIGKIARLGIAAFHNEAIISIRPHLAELDPYLFKVLPAAARQGVTKAAIKGATLNRESLTNILIPLPPLAEQHRIVGKVDELMALCDQLQAAHTTRESQRDALVAASLHCLTATEATPDQPAPPFTDAARFHLTHLPRLTTRPEHIQQLRQTILNLAVRGKLVEQSPDEESASELMKRIASKRDLVVAKRRVLTPSDESDRPFAAPSGWVWARMGDAFSIRTGFAFKSSTYASVGTLVLRVTNFDRAGCFDLSDSVFFPPEQIDERIERYLLEPGEILMVMVGGTIGKTAIVTDSVLPALLNQNMWRIRSFGAEMANRFEYLLIKTLNQLIGDLTQSTHGHFAMSDYELKQICIPPLAEQHRIVAKVDELMQLCDALQAELITGQNQRSHLLEALLYETLNPMEAL